MLLCQQANERSTMLEQQSFPETLGQLLESVHATSLMRWRGTHSQRVAVNDLLGHELEEVDLSCTHKRGGRVQVYVTLRARIKSRSETHFYRCQRTGPNEYVMVGSSEGGPVG